MPSPRLCCPLAPCGHAHHTPTPHPPNPPFMWHPSSQMVGFLKSWRRLRHSALLGKRADMRERDRVLPFRDACDGKRALPDLRTRPPVEFAEQPVNNIEQPVKQNEQLFDNKNNAKRRRSSSRLEHAGA
ncbi:hypothetical protein EI94DRAFT_1782275 [Lactarius quietus]|nr:hypothetical protein EI94DRAFT_1782275 [Lactarius quietus]